LVLINLQIFHSTMDQPNGQATVERGFSVDKQMKTDNLACDTFEARRLVCDHVAVVGVIQNIDVKNKQLLSSCSNAIHRYRTFLEDQKKEQAKAASAGKRKAVNDEVDQLKNRQHNVSLITKSNALRKAAKEKDSELKLVDQQLTDKLLQLSNCYIANMHL